MEKSVEMILTLVLEWHIHSIVFEYDRCRIQLVSPRRALLTELFRDGCRGERCRARGGRRGRGGFGRLYNLLRLMIEVHGMRGVRGGHHPRRMALLDIVQSVRCREGLLFEVCLDGLGGGLILRTENTMYQ